MEKQGIKPHVAVLPSVGMGHLIPLLELGKRLALHHGFRVTLLLITTNTPPSAAQDQLLCSPDIPSDLHILKLPPVDVEQVTTHDMLIMTRLCVITEHSLIGSLKSVLVALGLGQTRALVTDFFSTQAFDICNELSIPAYLFSTTCIAFSAFALYLPKLDSDVECEFIDLPEPIEVPGCSPVRTEDLLDQVRNRKNDEYKWFYFHVSRMPLASGILLNSWEDLEPVSLKAIKENPYFKHIPTPPVYPVGPLIKQQETLSRVDVECLEWLDKQPPDSVLFVALGSGGTLSLEQQNELAMGLELSQQRFIWVVRHPTDVTGSGTFFDSGGSQAEMNENDPRGYLPEGFLRRTEGVGLVVPSWGSQVAILGHPCTGGFLSHCGWNSSLESIAHGVPIIAWPLYAEQRMNATMLVDDIGVAFKLEKGAGGHTIFARQEISRVVRMVMEGEQGQVMRNRAKQLKQSAAKALDNMNGSSHHSLSFVSNLWKTTTDQVL
ncbi:UDP-glucuronosyl/UDP-glucosyltransferase [Corchorus olitorius]|uniref:Glycosyltransferase n=1 Tax=Corchorus olitorius TaxID=93759 RepID=A0A1R3KI88_9ROSI|nr:UDP-glucuronosyl/UDP-glucosyltransferase [Corchorus olitorius]